MTARAARKLLATLARKALLRLDGEAHQHLVSLHDLQHDYVRVAQGDLRDLHNLLGAGRAEELRQVLLDFKWLAASVAATDIAALIADYDLFPEDPDLRLVQGALRLSAHVLAQDKAQLASQLLGRLLDHPAPEIQQLLAQATQGKLRPWLRPVSPSMIPPGGRLLRTLGDDAHGVVVTPDGRHAISASNDETLKVWDMHQGWVITSFEGDAPLQTCAVAPNGTTIVVGDERVRYMSYAVRAWNGQASHPTVHPK